MARIPVNPNDLPTEYTILNDTLTYKAVVKELKLSDKPDKNGNLFLIGHYEIVEPVEFRGKTIRDYYIGLPGAMDNSMGDAERAMAMEKAVKLGRLIKSAGYKNDAPDFDTDELVGQTIEFDVKNTEYQGRMSSKINNYLS